MSIPIFTKKTHFSTKRLNRNIEPFVYVLNFNYSQVQIVALSAVEPYPLALCGLFFIVNIHTREGGDLRIFYTAVKL
jgi:hypothetical protein